MRTKLLASVAILLASGVGASAQEPGVTDTTIRIGNLAPLSGPASAYSTITRTIEAYFKKLNAEGGINGRKIEYVIVDDGYSPPKAVEGARRLVEQEEVAFLFNTLGTANNVAIRRYMNQREVPQLFVATGATTFGDFENYPWTMGWQPNYAAESVVYGQYLMDEFPNAKVAVLYQNDDYGEDLLSSLKQKIEGSTVTIVGEQPYETSDPTVDSQIVNLKASGADALILFATPKFAAQAINSAASIGWEPKLKIVNQVANSISQVLLPAGEAASKGYISAGYLKDPLDEKYADDAAVKEWTAFMDEYYPDGPKGSSFTPWGYTQAQTMQKVLEMAGGDLSRENVMKQAASLTDLELPMLLPGIRINTSATDFYPIEQMQLMRYNGGKAWEYFGEIIDASGSKAE